MRYKGVTLTELIVVMVVVAALASITVPIVNSYKRRAIISEAVQSLGVLQTVQKGIMARTGAYSGDSYDNLRPNVPFIGEGGIYPDLVNPGDFDGAYFSEGCYLLINAENLNEGKRRIALCEFRGSNNAPNSAEVKRFWPDTGGDAGPWLFLYEDGTITHMNVPESGLPEDSDPPPIVPPEF